MIEIPKRDGKKLNQICPWYISTTVHKRHYYMTECAKAYKELNEVRSKKKD